MKYLWLELYKLKHRKVFLTFLVILGVELLFVFSNYGNNNNFLNMISDPAAPAWEDLIIGPAAINGLFFPILAAVIASRICDMEHKGNTWKLLECNNQNRRSIWFCKFTIVSTLMMLAIFIQAFIIIAYGKNVIRFCAWNCDDNICSRYNSGFLLPCMYKPAYPYVYRYDRRTYWVYFHIAAAGYPQHFDLG